MGWGGFLDKLMSKLPISGRIERWKNELDNLKQERAALIISKCDEKKASRVIAIDKRIAYLLQLLENSSNAS